MNRRSKSSGKGAQRHTRLILSKSMRTTAWGNSPARPTCPFYITSLGQCDCYDFQRRQLPCKHIYRLAMELGVIELINRPSIPYTADELNAIREMDNPDTHPEQIKRMESARKIKAEKMELNRAQRSAIFAGSGKTPYITTESECTCRDFILRKLPCKHIYRLRMALDAEK